MALAVVSLTYNELRDPSEGIPRALLRIVRSVLSGDGLPPMHMAVSALL